MQAERTEKAGMGEAHAHPCFTRKHPRHTRGGCAHIPCCTGAWRWRWPATNGGNGAPLMITRAYGMGVGHSRRRVPVTDRLDYREAAEVATRRRELWSWETVSGIMSKTTARTFVFPVSCAVRYFVSLSMCVLLQLSGPISFCVVHSFKVSPGPVSQHTNMVATKQQVSVSAFVFQCKLKIWGT